MTTQHTPAVPITEREIISLLLEALEGLLPIVRYAAKCTCPDSQLDRCSYCRWQDALAAIAEATGKE